MRTDLGDVVAYTDPFDLAAIDDLFESVDDAEATAEDAEWADLETAGPSVTAPKAGMYMVSWGATAAGTVDNTDLFMGIHVDESPPTEKTSNCLSFGGEISNAGTFAAGSKSIHLELDAGTVVRCVYRGSADAAGIFRERWLSIHPIRLT